MFNFNKLFTFIFPSKVLYAKFIKYNLKLNRLSLILNLWLNLRFEMISKLVMKTKSLFMREVIEKKLKYGYKNSNIEKRGKFIYLLNLLTIHPKFLSLCNKSYTQYFQLIFYSKLYKYNRQLKLSLLSNITRILPIKSKNILELISLTQRRIKRANNQFLKKDKFLPIVLWRGGYSLTTLKNNTQISLFIMRPNILYSTKIFKFTSARFSTIAPNRYTKERAKSKAKDRLNTAHTNYKKGWLSNWLRKFRYLEILKKYKLNTTDKLLLRILKERKFNINKKIYQVQIPRSSETIRDRLNFLKSNDLESLINKNNTNLNEIKNTCWSSKSSAVQCSATQASKQRKKIKNSFSSCYAKKFSAVGKSRDLFKNKIIQYKFYRSNAKSLNLNKVWNGSYFSKQKKILSALPFLFDLGNWSGKEKFNTQDKKSFLFSSITSSSSIISTSSKIKKQINFPLRQTQSLIMGNLYKDRVEESKYENNKLVKEIFLAKEGKLLAGLRKQEAEIKKEFDIISNVKGIHDSLSLDSLDSNKFSLSKWKKDETESIFSSLKKNKSNLWVGCERIDIISLENLLKSFFKKMNSLISLPILEKLPDKLNIRLFYYLKKNAKTYYSSTNIINSNLRSIVGINLRLPQINSIFNKKKPVEWSKKDRFENLLDSPEAKISFPYKREKVLADIIDKPLEEISIGASKCDNINYRTKKGYSNYALRFKLSPTPSSLDAGLQNKSSDRQIPLFLGELPYPFNKEEINNYLNTIDEPKITKNKITNSFLSIGANINNLIEDLTLGGKSKFRNRSMQIFSLKYYWSKVINPSVKIRDSNTALENLKILSQNFYNSNVDALLTNSNRLRLHLFSKWRGESGQIEYKRKLNRNTRILQDEMIIKEAILFSNPLLKEIFDSQSLIYPYNFKKRDINERLGLFYNKKDNKMTFFNSAVKSISRSGVNNKSLDLRIASAFGAGKLKLINPRQSIVPIKLKSLKKDYIKNGILFKNSILKYIFNKNLTKLNLILFLARLKEITSISRSLPINTNTNLINLPEPKLNIRKLLHSNLAFFEGSLSNLHHNFELKLYKFNKRFDNLISVYKTSLTSGKNFKTILVLFSYFYREKLENLPINFYNIRNNKNLILKELNENTKASDIHSLNPKKLFHFINSLWQEQEINPFISLNKLALSLTLFRQDTDLDINLPLIRKISVINNINANYLYTLYKLINGKEPFLSKEQLVINSSINLGDLSPEDSRRNLRDIESLKFFENLSYTFPPAPPYRWEGLSFNEKLNYKIIDTKTLLGLDDIYISKRKNKLFDSPSINLFTSEFRIIDRELDSPKFNERKGLVSYNKILFKKLLVFLKLILNKEIELELTRINNPYNETHILNQILGEVIKYKSSSFVKLIKIIRENANIKPKFISELGSNPLKSASSNKLAQNKVNLPLKKKDFGNKIILDQSLYNYLFFPINLRKREELLNNYAKSKLNMLHNLEIDRNREKEVNGYREKENYIDKHISSYNYIALEKWSNFNQFNKQNKIYKNTVLDPKSIALGKPFLNDNKYKIDRKKNINRDEYRTKNRDIRGDIITNLTEQQGKEINYKNWRNIRNNLNIIKGNLSPFWPEIIKDILTNTPVENTYHRKTQNITNILNNESPSKIFSTLSIDSHLEWNKIKKILPYKMQEPLTISNNKLIYLYDANLSLSSLGKINSIKKKELNLIWRNKNTISYTSPSTSTISPMLTNIKSPLQQRKTRGGINAVTGKLNLVHSNISGIKLKLGGRLEKAPIIPRNSSQEVLIGNMSRGSTSFKDISRLTYKNKRGAYSITVILSYLSYNK